MPTIDLFRTDGVSSTGTVISGQNINADDGSLAVFAIGSSTTFNIDDLSSTSEGDLTNVIGTIDKVQLSAEGVGQDSSTNVFVSAGLEKPDGSNFNGYRVSSLPIFGDDPDNPTSMVFNATTTSDGTNPFTISDLNDARIFFSPAVRLSGTSSFIGIDFVKLTVTYTEKEADPVPDRNLKFFRLNGGNLKIKGGNLKI